MGRTGSTLLTFYFKPRADFRFQIVCTADIRLQLAMWQIAVALQTGQIAKETRADCRLQIAKSDCRLRLSSPRQISDCRLCGLAADFSASRQSRLQEGPHPTICKSDYRLLGDGSDQISAADCGPRLLTFGQISGGQIVKCKLYCP